MALILELDGIVKDYHGLRPLRLARLELAEGEAVGISGLDAAAAEVLTSLVTGAALPDHGTVRVFGEDTTAIADADAWLAGLDRFGILTDRVVLLDGLTVEQNIALPLTLQLDALPPEVAAAVRALAADVGLRDEALPAPAGDTSASDRYRIRLARALACGPRLLVMEHPTASLPRADVKHLAANLARILRQRRPATILVTDDTEFARVVTDRRFALNPATGALSPRSRRGWFS
jgi:ABC-type lipoprotein export system ATPase subunit